MGRSHFPVNEFRDHELVLVDESHNFRGADANRYKNLLELLSTGKPKKLILITATPVNNSLFDLYNQVRLITKDRDDFFTQAGITSLWGYFLQAGGNKEHFYDLLEEIAVRRSRHFVKQHYPNALIDGQPVRFPVRKLHTVPYSLEKAYAGLYREVADTIERLHLASYHLESFRKGVFPEQLSFWETLKEALVKQGWSPKDADAFLKRLGRGVGLVHILKTLYLKRLESSVEAFRVSLDRQMKFQQRFLELLKQGRLLDAASYRRIFVWNGADDVDEEEVAFEELIAELPSINPEEFRLEEIEATVEKAVRAKAEKGSGLHLLQGHCPPSLSATAGG